MSENDKRGGAASGGCGCFSIGGIIAFILSWQTFHSILWGLVAAFFGWGYIIYWLIRYWK